MKCRSIPPIYIKSVSVSVPCKYSSMDQRSNYSIAAVCIVAINKRSTAPSSIMPPRTRSKQNKASRFRKEAAPKRNLTARATRRAQPADECWRERTRIWFGRIHRGCWKGEHHNWKSQERGRTHLTLITQRIRRSILQIRRSWSKNLPNIIPRRK